MRGRLDNPRRGGGRQARDQGGRAGPQGERAPTPRTPKMTTCRERWRKLNEPAGAESPPDICGLLHLRR